MKMDRSYTLPEVWKQASQRGWTDVRPLRSGGQAELFLVDDVDGATRVLKVLRGEGAERAWRRELEVGRSLRHPALLRLLGSSPPEDRSLRWLVYPYAHRGTASGLLGRVESRELLVVGLRLLGALSRLHARQWIHGDLHPENILWFGATDEGPDLRIGDPGAALHERELERCQDPQLWGTPGYRAPEQEERPVQCGPWTDLYCLGRFLYLLWDGKHRAEVCSDTVRAWLNWLTDAEPSRRPRSAHEAAERLVRDFRLPALRESAANMGVGDGAKVVLWSQLVLSRQESHSTCTAVPERIGTLREVMLKAHDALRAKTPLWIHVHAAWGMGVTTFLQECRALFADSGTARVYEGMAQRYALGSPVLDAMHRELRLDGLLAHEIPSRIEGWVSADSQDSASLRSALVRTMVTLHAGGRAAGRVIDTSLVPLFLGLFVQNPSLLIVDEMEQETYACQEVSRLHQSARESGFPLILMTGGKDSLSGVDHEFKLLPLSEPSLEVLRPHLDVELPEDAWSQLKTWSGGNPGVLKRWASTVAAGASPELVAGSSQERMLEALERSELLKVVRLALLRTEPRSQHVQEHEPWRSLLLVARGTEWAWHQEVQRQEVLGWALRNVSIAERSELATPLLNSPDLEVRLDAACLVDDASLAISVVLELAREYFKRGNRWLAHFVLRRVDRLALRVSPGLRAEFTIFLANLSRLEGDLSAARELLERAQHWVTSDDARLLGLLDLGWGQVLVAEGDLDAARSRALSAVSAFERVDAVGYLAQTLWLVGSLERRMGDAEAAVDTFSRALRELEGVDDAHTRVVLHTGLGHAQARRNAYSQAIQAYGAAGELAEAHGYLADLATIHMAVGDVLRAEHRLGDADARYREAARLFRASGSGMERLAWLNVALTAWQREDDFGLGKALESVSPRLDTSMPAAWTSWFLVLKAGHEKLAGLSGDAWRDLVSSLDAGRLVFDPDDREFREAMEQVLALGYRLEQERDE